MILSPASSKVSIVTKQMNDVPECSNIVVPLPFEGFSGQGLTEYWVDYDGHKYFVSYKYGWIIIERDSEQELLEQKLGEETWWENGYWNDEATNVYLTLISEAIRHETVFELHLPTMEEVQAHSLYHKGYIPRHLAGIMCGHITPSEAPLLTGNRHERKKIMRLAQERGWHYHKPSCYQLVPACEMERWIVEHPQEHAALQAENQRQIELRKRL